MKRIVRLTESDLSRIVKRVIKEEDEATLEKEIEVLPPNSPIEKIQNIIDRIEAAGEDIQDFIERKKKEGKRFIANLENSLESIGDKIRFKRRRFQRRPRPTRMF